MNNFVVIGEAGRSCPWCDRAVALLDEAGLPYSIRKLEPMQLAFVLEAAKQKTIPVIYHGTNILGGYAELEIYLTLLEQ